MKEDGNGCLIFSNGLTKRRTKARRKEGGALHTCFSSNLLGQETVFNSESFQWRRFVREFPSSRRPKIIRSHFESSCRINFLSSPINLSSTVILRLFDTIPTGSFRCLMLLCMIACVLHVPRRCVSALVLSFFLRFHSIRFGCSIG